MGDSNTGKTHLSHNLCSTTHIANQIFTPTIGVDFYAKEITSFQKKIKLHIWDTSGDKAFKNIVQAYYNSVAGVMLVYDITKRESFENVQQWLAEFREKTHKLCDIPILIIGNYIDEKKERKVLTHELESFGEKNNTMVFEVCCADINNLSPLFQPLWDTITKTFLIPGKYNPGIKRLENRLFLDTQQKKKDVYVISNKKNIQSKKANKECIIS